MMNHMVPTAVRDSADELRNRVSRAFERWLPKKAEPAPIQAHTRRPSLFTGASMPSIDLAETDDEVLVYAELPGMDRKDFHVEVDDGRIVLRGEKKTSRKEKRRNYRMMESAYGSFYRAIPLPCEVESGKAKAKFKSGVLKVCIPKSEHAKAKSIHVTVN